VGRSELPSGLPKGPANYVLSPKIAIMSTDHSASASAHEVPRSVDRIKSSVSNQVTTVMCFLSA
ncbi:hypothetical protein L9F63_005631, partial [Diploptera punctata]